MAIIGVKLSWPPEIDCAAWKDASLIAFETSAASSSCIFAGDSVGNADW